MKLPLREPMRVALDEALSSAARGEVPVGAVLTNGKGEILAQAGNETLARKDITGHAEINVIRRAALLLGSERLPECDLYVTLEPCAMCAAAISFSRLRRVYFAATDEKMGAVESGIRYFNHPTCHHKPEVYSGMGEEQAQLLLKEFFRALR
jgi:tRNA(adenine34) deaminase